MQANVQVVPPIGVSPADRRDLAASQMRNRIGSVPVNLVLGQRGRIFDKLLTNQADY